MDRYFFDKRVIKKAIIKYVIIFAIALPILILANMLFTGLQRWTIISIDIAILALVVLLCEITIHYYKQYKEKLQDDKELPNKTITIIKKSNKDQTTKNTNKTESTQKHKQNTLNEGKAQEKPNKVSQDTNKDKQTQNKTYSNNKPRTVINKKNKG